MLMLKEHKHLDPPTKVPRKVTDSSGAVFFVFVVAVLLFAAVYAGRYGNRRIYDRKGTAFPQHLPDFSGAMCGQAEHAEERFVFFCVSPDAPAATLDYEHPVCRSACPAAGPNGTAPTTNHSCPAEGLDGTWAYGPVRDYASSPVAGSLCLPDDPQLVQARLFEAIQGLALQGASRSWVLEVSILMRAWKLVATSALLSVVLGVAYMQLLRRHAGAVVRVCLVLSVAGPALLGTAFVYSSQWDAGFCPGSADRCLSSGLVLLLLVGVLAAGFAAGLRRDLAAAVECCSVAERCARDVPALLWEPLVAVGIRAAVLCLMVPLLASLLACGRVHVDPATDRASFRHGLPSLLLLVLAAASLAWLLELSAALSEFATSFAVQTWFFSTETGRSDLLVARGYIRGVRYHLGTLAWGSLLIPLARFPRMAAACCGACEGSRDGPCVDLGPVALPAQAPEAQAPAAAGPPGARPRGGLHRLHRRAYVDTAHGGRAFCEASARAAEVMALAGGLEGVMLICKGAGVGAIATAGAALTYACCRSLPMYSGPERAEYVQDPMFLATASAVASFVLALPLAGVFDKVVDTIVYCAAVGDSPGGGAAQLEAGLRHALELRGRSGDL